MDGGVVDDAIYGIKLELEGAGMKAEHSFISGTCRAHPLIEIPSQYCDQNPDAPYNIHTHTHTHTGHSLGGVRSQDHAKAHADEWDGQILMAACLLRLYDNATFPLPTLTVGGEKDGNMRVSRVAQSSHVYRRQGPEVAARFPVVAIPGANHMSFASGTPPVNVAAVDLTPEISRAEGHAAIAAVVADFVRGRVAAAKAGEGVVVRAAGEALAAALQATAELVDPLIEAMLLEGSWRFDAPCNSDHPSPHCPFYPAWPEQPEARTPSDVTACVCGSPWVEQVAQAHVGDLEGYATYVVRDAFHDVRDTGQSVSQEAYVWPSLGARARVYVWRRAHPHLHRLFTHAHRALPPRAPLEQLLRRGAARQHLPAQHHHRHGACLLQVCARHVRVPFSYLLGHRLI